MSAIRSLSDCVRLHGGITRSMPSRCPLMTFQRLLYNLHHYIDRALDENEVELGRIHLLPLREDPPRSD